MPRKKKTPICLGLLSEQQAPCHQWCLFVTKQLSPISTTNTPKYLMNWGGEREEMGVITNGSNKTQEKSFVKPNKQQKKTSLVR